MGEEQWARGKFLMRLSPMPCSLSAWALHTLWHNVILILIFICHSPCAMCYSPFAIPTAAFSPASGGGGMRHEARLLSLRFSAFVWLCCLRLCHFCRSCSHRRRLNSTHLLLLLLLPSSVYILCMLFVHWL